MVKPSVSVTLQIGSTTAEIGTVDLPIVSTPAGRDAVGLWQVEFHVDHAAFRRRIADLLRSAADEFEKGPADG
ncbi:hypothetical protein [Nonomuraea sp. 10N515B]|uniref:hypothetical protein n=1 Tax=Nonomuraea sp. 10N515B TaxID=3457422 RepID=UPI003FCD8746